MKIVTLCLLILFTLLLGCSGLRHEAYSNGDIYREVAVQTLNVMDFASTDKVLGDNPTRAMESNPLLGPHPSRDRLIGVCVATGLIHAVVTHYMPAKWRPYWQYPFIVIKAGAVANNYHVAVGLQF